MNTLANAIQGITAKLVKLRFNLVPQKIRNIAFLTTVAISLIKLQEVMLTLNKNVEAHLAEQGECMNRERWQNLIKLTNLLGLPSVELTGG